MWLLNEFDHVIDLGRLGAAGFIFLVIMVFLAMAFAGRD